MANGTVFSAWLPQPVPVHHVHDFGAKIQNKTEMADPARLLFALELFDDCELETNEFLDENDDVIYFIVVSSYTRRNLS